MASYNRVVLMGNLTRDPELRYIPSGTAVSEIGLAVNDRVKRNEQWVDEATFVDVTLWGRTAEVANEYLSKGSNVLIEGRLKLDMWEKEGQKRSKLRVVADKMQMVGTRGGRAGQNTGGQNTGGQNTDGQYTDGQNTEGAAGNADSSGPRLAQESATGSEGEGAGSGEYAEPAPALPPSDEIPF